MYRRVKSLRNDNACSGNLACMNVCVVALFLDGLKQPTVWDSNQNNIILYTYYNNIVIYTYNM